MQLVTNSIDTDTVREETRNGRDFLVAPVTVARPMSLNGGFVSDETLANTVGEWNNVPLPIGHPVDANGNYITARLPEVLDSAVVGNLYYDHYDFEARELNGELWVDVQRAENLGAYGDRIVEIFENGEELEVSSAYRGEKGIPGTYDGIDGEEYRDEVKVNLRPDHVALLPDELGPGKCACADGCGVEPSEGIESNTAIPGDAEPFANTIGVSGHAPSPAGPDAVPGAGYCVNSSDGENAAHVVVNMVADGGTDLDANVAVDDRVRWDSSGGYAYGRIRETVDEDGEIAASDFQGDSAMTGPAALIALYNEDEDGEWSVREGDYDGEARVAHKTDDDTLTTLDSDWQPDNESQNAACSTCDHSSSESAARNRNQEESDEMHLNQSQGDRVRWTGADDEMQYGTVVDELEDDEGSVRVAVYEQEETDEDDDSMQWVRSGETVTADEDDLTVIDQFPAQAASTTANSDSGHDSGNLQANILAEARTPTYSATMSSEEFEESDMDSWDLWWGLDDYLDAWVDETGSDYNGDPYSALSEVPEGAREWIAEKSLLGNPDAETEDNLTLGEVVGPDGTLYEDLLEDVVGTEGSRWTIPDEQRESARSVANQLLADEFGHDVDANTASNEIPENPPGWFQRFADGIGLGNLTGSSSSEQNGGRTCDCEANSHEECTCGTQTNGETMTSDEYTDDDLEQIANHDSVAFSVGQLRKMDDEQVAGLNALVENADGESGEGDETPNGEAQGNDDDPDGTDDGVDANDDIPEPIANRLNEMQSTIDAQQETIKEYEANRDAKRSTRREEAVSTIKANSSQYTDEILDGMEVPQLEATASALVAANNGTDWGGLNDPVPTDVEGNDEERERTTKSGGTFGEFSKNQEAQTSD